MPACCRKVVSTQRISKAPVRHCAVSSGSGSEPAIWCSAGRYLPLDFFADAAFLGCECVRSQSRRTSMAPQLFPLGPALSVAGRLDRADIDALAEAGVRTIINNRPDGEDPGQLPAIEARRIAEAHGIAYRHIPITTATLSRADVTAFAAALRETPAPVVS